MLHPRWKTPLRIRIISSTSPNSELPLPRYMQLIELLYDPSRCISSRYFP